MISYVCYMQINYNLVSLYCLGICRLGLDCRISPHPSNHVLCFQAAIEKLHVPDEIEDSL